MFCLTGIYKGVTGYEGDPDTKAAKIKRELVADLVGDYIFTDAKFAERLLQSDRNVFQKVWDEIKHISKLATAGTEEAKLLEKAKHNFQKAWDSFDKNSNKNTTENGGEVRYSIHKDINGDTFVNVENITISKSDTAKDIVDILSNIVESKFSGFVEANKQQIGINKGTAKEWRWSKNAQYLYDTDIDTYTDKMNAFNYADELLRASRDYIGEKNKHTRKDNFVEFARGNVNFKVGENGYSADIVVGTTKNGIAVLRDIVNLQSKEIEAASNAAQDRRTETPSTDNIPENSEIVKHKEKQFEIIEKSNPAPDSYHTWIRSKDDVKTFEETLNDGDWSDGSDFDPDYTWDMAQEALESGEITVYSSYPIANGVFVTPSAMEAASYSGDGKVYSKTVKLEDVAWIDPTQGMYANTTGAVNHSISQAEIDRFADQIDNIQAIPSNEALVVCGTPKIFLDIGLNNLPMTLNLEHAKDAITYNPSHSDRFIGEQTLKSLPQALQKPIAIISSKSNSKTSLVAIVELKGQNGKSVIAPVYLNGLSRSNGISMDVNAIASVHERNNAISGLLTDALTEEASGNIGVFFIDNKKVTQLARSERLQLPNIVASLDGSIHSISENGSPVKGHFKNILQTDTKQFKSWFGKSKVVDKSEKPLVVYHGTNEQFSTFDKSKFNTNESYGDYVGEGFYFADTYEKAQKYGSNVMPVYLSIENPLVINTEADAQRFREEFKGMFEGGNEALRNILGGKYDYYELMKSNPSKVREYLQSKGYDGLVDNLYGQYAVFDSTQIKSATDNIGTFDGNNPDIRYSLSDSDIAPVIYGNDVRGTELLRSGDIAPIGESVAREAAPAADAAVDGFEDIAQADNFDTDGFEDILSAEGEYQAKREKLGNGAVKNIAKQVNDFLKLNRTDRQALQEIVQMYSQAENIDLSKLRNELSSKFQINNSETLETVATAKRHIRGTRIEIPSSLIGEITQYYGSYADFVRSHRGSLSIRRNGEGMNIDTVYMELSEAYPDLFPDDITHPADQLFRISEVSKMPQVESVSMPYPDEVIDQAVDVIASRIENGRLAESQVAELEREIEQIMTEPEMQVYESYFGEGSLGEGLAKTNAKENADKKKNRAISHIRRLLIDKGSVFEDIDFKNKDRNKTLYSDWQWMISSEARAQQFINKGNNGARPLLDLYWEVQKSGKANKFNDYVYHLLNIERMSTHANAVEYAQQYRKENLAGLTNKEILDLSEREITGKTSASDAVLIHRAKKYQELMATENKPVFGDEVTAKTSQMISDRLLADNPEFEGWAQDLYRINRQLTDMAIEHGLISEETAAKLEKMYPHYVPIYRVDKTFSSGKEGKGKSTSVNAPFKRVEGGNSDIESVFSAMATRIGQVYKATARNDLGTDLMETLKPKDGAGSSRKYASQADISAFVEKAGNNSNEVDHMNYADPSERLMNDVANEVDISEYVHTLRDNDIRHIYNSHGTGTNEKYPITSDDIKAIPKIVQNYDKVFVVKRAGKDAMTDRTGIIYVKVNQDNTVYYLEQVTDKYHNEKLLVNKQMIKVGIDDIPHLKGLEDAITKKQSKAEYLADLKEARKVYAQSVTQPYSNNIIPDIAPKVNTASESTTEVDDSVEALETLGNTNGDLKPAENGKAPTFTIFQDGKRVTFDITEDIYDALNTSRFENWLNEISDRPIF